MMLMVIKFVIAAADDAGKAVNLNDLIEENNKSTTQTTISLQIDPVTGGVAHTGDVEEYEDVVPFDMDSCLTKIGHLFETKLNEFQAKNDIKFGEIQAKLTRIENNNKDVTKEEFAKLATLINNVMKTGGTTAGLVLLPTSTAEAADDGADGETAENKSMNNEILEELNSKISTSDAIDKLDQDLKNPKTVADYVGFR